MCVGVRLLAGGGGGGGGGGGKGRMLPLRDIPKLLDLFEKDCLRVRP